MVVDKKGPLSFFGSSNRTQLALNKKALLIRRNPFLGEAQGLFVLRRSVEQEGPSYLAQPFLRTPIAGSFDGPKLHQIIIIVA